MIELTITVHFSPDFLDDPFLIAPYTINLPGIDTGLRTSPHVISNATVKISLCVGATAAAKITVGVHHFGLFNEFTL